MNSEGKFGTYKRTTNLTKQKPNYNDPQGRLLSFNCYTVNLFHNCQENISRDVKCNEQHVAFEKIRLISTSSTSNAKQELGMYKFKNLEKIGEGTYGKKN